MKAYNRACVVLVTLSALLFSSRAAFAFYDFETTLDVNGFVAGLCTFTITNGEPYSHLNGDCDLEKNTFLIQHYQIAGWGFGTPASRPPTYVKNWPTLRPTVEENSVYCQRFGSPLDFEGPIKLTLGHVSNPAKNKIEPGKSTCGSPLPQVKAYWQQACVGGFVWVFDLGGLVPGVHASYRLRTSPLVCYAYGVLPGY